VIRPCLEEGVSQAEQVRASGVALSTLQRWISQYRKDGLCGLAKQPRADRGTRRNLSEEVIKLIEGLALSKPRRSMATIQRQVAALAAAQGWVEPSYRQVYEIVKELPQALVTLALGEGRPIESRMSYSIVGKQPERMRSGKRIIVCCQSW
jgi:putative transposase